jgi:hypothetical protein
MLTTRWIFQRSLGFIYFIGFLIFLNQGLGLLGANGLEPIHLFVSRVSFWQSPSLFFFNDSNVGMLAVGWLGIALSLFAISGRSDLYSPWTSALVWISLWVLYLSIVNVGQTFYGFGWETLLLETGFLAIFLGSTRTPPPMIVMWLLRWLLFRMMFGAGMIKLRGDECWRDLSCLFYHYETQPSPNPLSWYFHHLPRVSLQAGVAFNHFVELIVPLGFFGPRLVRTFAALFTIVFQLTLILSGNLSWLNYITIVIALSCLDDTFWQWFLLGFKIKAVESKSGAIHRYVHYGLAIIVSVLSIRPAWNLVSPTQLMNASFEPLHLVNTYGAFGSITRERTEVIIEGTDDNPQDGHAIWKEYGFNAKVGDVNRRPPQVTPYHYKLDWQMWFASMTPYQYNPWIVNLVAKLLAGQSDVVGLLRTNPFPDHPPAFIRARLYRYRFARAGTEGWWTRELLSEYLPPLSLSNPNFRKVLEENGWL